MDIQRRRATIRDVAEKASVSLKTVSRVLNGSPQVRDETRRRVLQVMRELNYRPNVLARGLVTRRTGSIGMIIADITNPFYPEVVRGAQDAAYRRGESVVLCNSDEDPASEQGHIEDLQERRVDGIVICASRVDAGVLVQAAETGTPIVLINREVDHPRIASVSVDHLAGVEAALGHLLGLGRRRIGYIAGPDRSEAARVRGAGFKGLVAKAFPGQPVRCIEGVAPRREAGRAAAHRLLERWPDTDAIFTYNDLMGLGALDALRERGLPVPQRVAVVGFDGIPQAAASVPPLTTVAQPKYELGYQAIDLLRRLIEGTDKASPRVVRLSPALVVRGTTRPGVADDGRTWV